MSGIPPILAPISRSRPIFTVQEVEGGWELSRFAGTGSHVYDQDRYWTPPLARERRRCLLPEHNPDLHDLMPGLFLAEARNVAWTDTPAGSLAVWFDTGELQRGEGVTASFGMFEAANEPEIADRLFDAAETWLYRHVPGLVAIRGPLSLEPLHPPGLLVDGFDARPAAYLPYNLPYYSEMIEAAGYRPAFEWHTYTLSLDELAAPDAAAAGGEVEVIRGAALAEQAPRLSALLMAAAEPEEAFPDEKPGEDASPLSRMSIYPIMRGWQGASPAEAAAETWDDAEFWAEAEDAEPEDETGPDDESDLAWTPTPEELLPGLGDALTLLSGGPAPRFGREGRLALRWLMPRSLAAIVQRDGEDVAALLALPDVSRGLRVSRGRLLPFGWMPYRLAAASTTGLRGLPVILRAGRDTPDVHIAVYAALASAAREQGFGMIELGPVSSADAVSGAALTALAARRSRTYHIYQKDL
jgi:hypothetical protein